MRTYGEGFNQSIDGKPVKVLPTSNPNVQPGVIILDVEKMASVDAYGDPTIPLRIDQSRVPLPRVY